MKTDEQLQLDVMDELAWEPILEAPEIGVAVKNGVVTLSGYVNSYAKKIAAESAAKRVKDVKAVAEDIEVRLSPQGQRTDTEIAESVVKALQWNTSVPDERIKARVDNGWVYLEGDLDWQYQKDAAANAVKYLTGVRGVSNLIKIKPSINTRLVEENIKKALERRADIEADKINIETEGSKIILKGSIRSWKERSAVEDAVWGTPGVMDVEDKLVIEA